MPENTDTAAARERLEAVLRGERGHASHVEADLRLLLDHVRQLDDLVANDTEQIRSLFESADRAEKASNRFAARIGMGIVAAQAGEPEATIVGMLRGEITYDVNDIVPTPNFRIRNADRHDLLVRGLVRAMCAAEADRDVARNQRARTEKAIASALEDIQPGIPSNRPGWMASTRDVRRARRTLSDALAALKEADRG